MRSPCSSCATSTSSDATAGSHLCDAGRYVLNCAGEMENYWENDGLIYHKLAIHDTTIQTIQPLFDEVFQVGLRSAGGLAWCADLSSLLRPLGSTPGWAPLRRSPAQEWRSRVCALCLWAEPISKHGDLIRDASHEHAVCGCLRLCEDAQGELGGGVSARADPLVCRRTSTRTRASGRSSRRWTRLCLARGRRRPLRRRC